MQQIYPQECINQVNAWQDIIAQYTQNLIQDFDKKYSHGMQPTQQEYYLLHRSIINDPYYKLCMNAICQIYSLYCPTIILTNEEAKILNIRVDQ